MPSRWFVLEVGQMLLEVHDEFGDPNSKHDSLGNGVV